MHFKNHLSLHQNNIKRTHNVIANCLDSCTTSNLWGKYTVMQLIAKEIANALMHVHHTRIPHTNTLHKHYNIRCRNT